MPVAGADERGDGNTPGRLRLVTMLQDQCTRVAIVPFSEQKTLQHLLSKTSTERTAVNSRTNLKCRNRMFNGLARLTGLEPATSGVTGRYSIQTELQPHLPSGMPTAFRYATSRIDLLERQAQIRNRKAVSKSCPPYGIHIIR